MELAFSLGSNLGDRLPLLSEAKRRLLSVPGTTLLAQSPVYETEPVGVKPEYRHLAFLNAVVVVESVLRPDRWIDEVGRIERDMGRVRTADRYAPRELDVDLLYAGDVRSGEQRLTVPHPRMAQRRFVLQPLADVRPDLVLPGHGRSVRDLLAELPPGEDVRLFARAW